MLEFRVALRLLRKQPVVTLTTLFALTVGIAVTTAGFTVVDSVIFSRLPFPNGDRFVLLDVYTEPEAERTGLDFERFRLFSTQAAALEHLGAFGGAAINLRLASGEVVPIKGTSITAGSIGVFPYSPIVGRPLRPEDGHRGAPPVVLLKESLWRRHFSSDPQVIGTFTTIAGVQRTVVGVMPDDFKFPNSPDIWLPLEMDASSWSSARTFGVLKPGVDPRAATAELEALSKQIEVAGSPTRRLRLVVLHFTDALSKGLELLTAVFVGCLVLVLAVIAANIANLALARTESRSREMAVRTALGATRQRLIGQVFLEILIVSTIAAVIGFAASQAALTSLRATLSDMPFWIDFTASVRTMAFVACAVLLTACLGGLVPALKATRPDTAAALGAAGRTTSTGFGVAGGLMVAAQVALSIALLNGALVIARGVAGYMRPTLPIAATEVLTARVGSEGTTPDSIVNAIARIPGVTAAGASSSLPGLSPSTELTIVEDSLGGSASVPRPAPVVAVQEGFFHVLGASRYDGRLFTPADFSPNAPPVAIVNEPFVTKFLAGMNPLGRRLRVLPTVTGGTPGQWREIVGVVPDLGLSAGDSSMAAGFYVPMGREQFFHLALRTSGDARRLSADLRAALDRLDPSIQVYDIVPLQDVGREDRAVFAGIGASLAALGGVALLLSVIATYAILSLAVTRRTREIGIRSALGATRRQILQTVIGGILVPPALGALAGIALGRALVAARGIFAFRLPEDSGPWGLPTAAALMIVAALVSAWVPARRALAVAPADALRSD